MKAVKLFEEFSSAKNLIINEICYGMPTREKHELAQANSPMKEWFIKEGWVEKIVNACPANDSKETLKDFDVIIGKMKNLGPDDITFARFADDRIGDVFLDFLAAKGITESMEEFTEKDDLNEALLFFLKDLINRPRPYQLAKYLNILFYQIIHTDANTASFPSGHALTGFLMGEYYSRKYPDFRNELEALGDRIANSREQMGIHYPSDTAISKTIAKVIWDNNLLTI